MTSSERRGDSVILRCADSDRAIRALLDHYPEARDIEISGAALEDAFLRLTGTPATAEQSEQLMKVSR